MIIQLALDRMTIAEAIEVAELAEPYVDWIEVGTSLIKEFGMASVRELRGRFPTHKIVADVKTFDNAAYEFSRCFESGADIATVMGAAPAVTIDVCLETAREFGTDVMIDLLNVPPTGIEALATLGEAIVCAHLSKDQQESSGGQGARVDLPLGLFSGDRSARPRLAVAGGITAESLEDLTLMRPDILIVGSAITGAGDPAAAARAMRGAADEWRERVRS